MATTDTTALTDPDGYTAHRTWPAVGDTVRTRFPDDPDTIYEVIERIPNRHGAYLLKAVLPADDEPGTALHHELIPADLPPAHDEN